LYSDEEDEEEGELKVPSDIIQDVAHLEAEQLYLVCYIRLKSDQEIQQDSLVRIPNFQCKQRLQLLLDSKEETGQRTTLRKQLIKYFQSINLNINACTPSVLRYRPPEDKAAERGAKADVLPFLQLSEAVYRDGKLKNPPKNACNYSNSNHFDRRERGPSSAHSRDARSNS